MAGQTPQRPRGARKLAKRQHWAISRRQLLELDYTRHAIYHRVADGRLYPVFRGVFAMGRPDLSRYEWCMAAALASGPRATVTDGSAAALWEMLPPARGPIHVCVPNGRGVRGIRTRRRRLTARDVTRHHGIPVTSVVCTLIDLAAQLSRADLERATTAADKLGLIDPDALRRELDSYAGRAGVPKLRETLDRRTYVMTDSELERRFLPIVRRAGLPTPLTQVLVNGFKVDFYWPDLDLVVETDGLTYHRTPAQQAKDAVRDQAHAAHDLLPLRFPHGQVRYEPEGVEEILRAVGRRRRR